MSFSNTQQAGDCVDSSGLLWVNYCPVQLEVQLKGQDSFRGMERRNSMIWVGEAGSGEEKEKEMGRERIQECEFHKFTANF